MKIGIVVDGVAEYESLGKLFPSLSAASGHTYLKVVRADIQPKAPLPAIARSCKDAVVQLEARGAGLVLIVFDREDRPECPGEISEGVARPLGALVRCQVSVVVKDRKYENWLVADLGALAAHRARYLVAPRHRRLVEPNKADRVDAIPMIKSIVKGDYDKVDDSMAIMERAAPDVMSRHSRSFRKFLREACHPLYSSQSLLPR